MNAVKGLALAGEPPLKVNKDRPRLRDRETKHFGAIAQDVEPRMLKRETGGRSDRFTETS